ncbi:MAG: trxA [Limisphaerales bacterium]|nr:MAG: trxA [Limisphaerales bacterium]KAG0508717.1 MAG: trxA [Limisphaerales bacterium]TXT50367.1 MAG: trxA [Limisphaerales bacterium]
MRKLFCSLAITLALLPSGLAADLTWLTDLPKAKEQAKAQGRLVLLDFTGSDFCSSCIRLHKEVFATKEFAEYAKKRLVLMELDFPLKKKQPDALKEANAALAKEFKVDGYPTLIVLASDGKKLGEVEFDLFDATAKDLITGIEKLVKPAKK